jgi:hypothetical protein
MAKKLDTIDLKGKSYATVPTRTKEFREDCPNGLIETKPDVREDGQVVFSARVLKDKSNSDSAEATGHSIGKITGDKAFEKLETIAIGRALAILGYMASGEIASSEEMESFLQYKEGKKDDAIAALVACESLDGLKDVYMGLGSLMGDPDIRKTKDDIKSKLTK